MLRTKDIKEAWVNLEPMDYFYCPEQVAQHINVQKLLEDNILEGNVQNATNQVMKMQGGMPIKSANSVKKRYTP